jgi:general secretion pathway protein F/type IV pilus assembly protein PilC
MLFRYQGFDKSGKKVKSKIEASSYEEAKLKLKANSIIFTSLKEDKFNLFGKISFKRTYKIDPLTLATISQDISIYLESGISLLNSIKLIEQRYRKDKKLNAFFNSLLSFLEEGKTFYSALEMQKSVKIPEFYLESVKISEDGGILQQVLNELSTYLKEQDRLNKQITSALAYPIFILVVSILMVGFMLSFIVPKITNIFKQYDQALPAITDFVINVGEFVSGNYQILLGGFVLTIIVFGYLMDKSKVFKYKVDSLVLKIPFFGELISLSELSRFSYINSILIKSGVPIVQSIKLSANILKNSVYKKLFEVSSTKVVEGEKLSRILETSKIHNVDRSFIQAIAIGEETSRLSSILENLTKLYSQKSKDKITIFLSLLEPFFMLVVGSIIGFIVVAMLLPIFSMNFG